MSRLTNLSVRLSDEEKQEFEKYCKDEYLTMSQVLRRLIREYCEKQCKGD